MGAVTLSTHLESLGTLQSEWDDVLDRSNAKTVFSSWDWQELWWNSFGEGVEPLVIAVRDGVELVGIAPLLKDANTIRFIGGTDVSDYLDFIAVRGQERDVLSAVVQYLRRLEWDELDLHCLRSDSPTLEHLPNLAQVHGLACSKELEIVCPVADLPGDWESYVASLGKKDRHELRRKMRRLESSGAFSWYMAPPTTDPSVYTETFLRLCRLSKEEKAVFLDDERVEQFFRDIIMRFQPTGRFKIYFLEIDGEQASVTLVIDAGEEWWLYNSGFDPSYSHLSVGLLLKAFCIKDAIEAGKKKFDFLRGREPYKYDLGAKDRPIYRLRITKTLD